MENNRDPNREFSSEVRKAERIAAKNACRICGKSKDSEWLQHAHIYTLSLNPNWERAGSDYKRWNNNNHVSSEANCLALCKTHHNKIDSSVGLQKVTVQYLESLKSDTRHCTALIGPVDKEWRRCQKPVKENAYRCHLHPNGGHEETLIARNGGWPEKKPKKPQAKEKKPQAKEKKVNSKSKENKVIVVSSKPTKKSNECILF